MMEKSKRVNTGFIHLLKCRYQFYSLRAKAVVLSILDWFDRHNNALPLPPPLLRYRVHARLKKEGYLEVGENCANDIRQLMLSAGKDLYDCQHVLDFGCGNGRVIRFFHDKPASCHLYGTDIDKESIDWCRKNLRFAQWETNDFSPPLPYASNSFDCIYAISVFTHIDEQMQFDWLEELHRVSAPGAIVILTIHGKSCFFQLTEEKRKILETKGIYFDVGQTGRFKHDGLPDFYQTTYHTRSYIDQQWSKYFKVIGYKEQGINAHQDAVILQKA